MGLNCCTRRQRPNVAGALTHQGTSWSTLYQTYNGKRRGLKRNPARNSALNVPSLHLCAEAPSKLTPHKVRDLRSGPQAYFSPELGRVVVTSMRPTLTSDQILHSIYASYQSTPTLSRTVIRESRNDHSKYMYVRVESIDGE